MKLAVRPKAQPTANESIGPSGDGSGRSSHDSGYLASGRAWIA